MNKKEKLFTRRKLIIVVLAVCGGSGWSAYKYYLQKGRIDTTLVISLAASLVIALSIVCVIAWWANKPEKGGK